MSERIISDISENAERQMELYEGMSKTSKKMLREDPLGYAATRKRQITAALIDGDTDQLGILLKDIAGMTGEVNADDLKMILMGKLVDQSLDEQEKELNLKYS